MAVAASQRIGDAVLSFGLAGLVFAGCLAYGANTTTFALVEASAWFAVLAAILAQMWGRAAFEPMRLGYVAAPFCVVLVLSLLSLTPFGVGGVHPVWQYVAGRGSVSIDPYATLVEIVKLAGLAATFLAGAIVGADDERAKRLLRAILLLGIAYSAWAFVDHFLDPVLLFGEPRAWGSSRLSASFLSGNTAATLFGALTILNVTDIARRYESERRPGRFHISQLEPLLAKLAVPIIGVLSSATCLILTLSRVGIASTLAVSVVLMGAIALSQSKRGAVGLPIAATAAILLGLLAASAAANIDAFNFRLSMVDADALTRSRIFAAHWQAFQASPWSGYGLGTFAHVNAMIMNTTNVAALDRLGAAHNIFIQWLEQGGILGAVAMALTVAMIAFGIVTGAIRRRRTRSWLLAILAVLGLYGFHGTTDYALEVPAMATFLSLLLGLGWRMASN